MLEKIPFAVNRRYCPCRGGNHQNGGEQLDDQAETAHEKRRVEEWYLNILGVAVSADDATVKMAYKAQILRAVA